MKNELDLGTSLDQVTKWAPVYEVVSSVHGSLYCGYSLTCANEAFDDAHQELSPTFVGDNLALYQGSEPIRVFWGQVSPSVADKYAEIVSKRMNEYE